MTSKRGTKGPHDGCGTEELCGQPLRALDLLNVGGSTGIMDNFLAERFNAVTSIDIDDVAITHAQGAYGKQSPFSYRRRARHPIRGRAIRCRCCVQVYEHVPDARAMFDEIFRVLRPEEYLPCGHTGSGSSNPTTDCLCCRLCRSDGRIIIFGSPAREQSTTKNTQASGAEIVDEKVRARRLHAEDGLSPERYHIEYMIRPRSLKRSLRAPCSCTFLGEPLVYLVAAKTRAATP